MRREQKRDGGRERKKEKRTRGEREEEIEVESEEKETYIYWRSPIISFRDFEILPKNVLKM